MNQQNSKAMPDKKIEMPLSVFIRGWKELATYTKYHSRTLREWHYTRARLPVIRTSSNKRGKWVTTPDRVYLWFMTIGKDFKD